MPKAVTCCSSWQGCNNVGCQRTQEFGFYLIGGIHIEQVFACAGEGDATTRIARNAHVIRARALGNWDTGGGFHVFTGSERSRRFNRAVPVTRDLCDEVFRDKNGAPWRWPVHRSGLSVIGSYTRTCRCMLDTSDAEQAGRAGALRSWIARHAGEHDAELLGGRRWGGRVMTAQSRREPKALQLHRHARQRVRPQPISQLLHACVLQADDTP